MAMSLARYALATVAVLAVAVAPRAVAAAPIDTPEVVRGLANDGLSLRGCVLRRAAERRLEGASRHSTGEPGRHHDDCELLHPPRTVRTD